MVIPQEKLTEYIDCDDGGTPGMIRVSFGIYNTEEEVDEFLRILADVTEQTRIEIAGNIEEGLDVFPPEF